MAALRNTSVRSGWKYLNRRNFGDSLFVSVATNSSFSDHSAVTGFTLVNQPGEEGDLEIVRHSEKRLRDLWITDTIGTPISVSNVERLGRYDQAVVEVVCLCGPFQLMRQRPDGVGLVRDVEMKEAHPSQHA